MGVRCGATRTVNTPVVPIDHRTAGPHRHPPQRTAHPQPSTRSCRSESTYWLQIAIGKLPNDRYIPLYLQLKKLLDDSIPHHRQADCAPITFCSNTIDRLATTASPPHCVRNRAPEDLRRHPRPPRNHRPMTRAPDTITQRRHEAPGPSRPSRLPGRPDWRLTPASQLTRSVHPQPNKTRGSHVVIEAEAAPDGS
jgi:hypothetical protein